MTDKGTFRAYGEAKKLGTATMAYIGHANAILEEYESKGHVMTLRQLYYQMVARGLTGGENTKALYDRIGNALNVGRLQGLVSWTALEDRGRNLQGLNTYDSIGALLKTAKADYRRDLWIEQPWRPEVWVEKDALTGVISHICNRLRVDFFACKGYNSQSEQWRAGRRFARYIQKGQRPIVFHLGDHDPSGLDMTRDNRDRLSMFAGTPIILQRLALNMNQVEELNPPPNPAKLSDSRADEYIREFGDSSWELDALDPVYIEKLIENAILKVRDHSVWEQSLAREVEDQRELADLIEGLS